MSLALSFVSPPYERVRRVVVRTVGIAGADVASQIVGILLVAWPIGAVDAAMLLSEIAGEALVLGFLLALTLEVREGGAGRIETWRLRAGLAIGVAAAVGLSTALARGEASTRLGLAASVHSLRLHTLWNDTVIALVAIAYLTRRTQSTQAEQQRRTQESRLQEARRQLGIVAAQTSRSRLEPQMLFDCMSRARDAYGQDRSRGDTLLERLTHYLRLTLGGTADDACTLGREAAIAAARIDVERCDGDPPLGLQIPADLEGRPFPPELLSTLARDWLAAADGVPRSLGVSAATPASSLQVTVVGPCPVPPGARRACERTIAAFTLGRGTVRQDGRSLHMELAHANR